MSDPTWITFCSPKPQPTHTKEELAKTTVYPPGATSTSGTDVLPIQRIDYLRKTTEIRKARARAKVQAQKATG